MISACMIIGLFVILAGWANWLRYHEIRDGRWHAHGYGQMRRYREGKWECRPMTEREEFDYISMEAW